MPHFRNDCGRRLVAIFNNFSYRLVSWVSLLILTSVHCSAGTPIVLSTDVGNWIDDQWAIAYVFTHPDLQPIALISAHAPDMTYANNCPGPTLSARCSYDLLKDIVENRLGKKEHPPIFMGLPSTLAESGSAPTSEGVEFLIRASQRFSKDNRLPVLIIGAATDIAAALIRDKTLADRISVIAMAFKDATDPRSYNVNNDLKAWDVLLDSRVPITVGSAGVCKPAFELAQDKAASITKGHGPVGDWLWSLYTTEANLELNTNHHVDITIWDVIVLAEIEGMTHKKQIQRPILDQARPSNNGNMMQWITDVDYEHFWADFEARLKAYSSK